MSSLNLQTFRRSSASAPSFYLLASLPRLASSSVSLRQERQPVRTLLLLCDMNKFLTITLLGFGIFFFSVPLFAQQTFSLNDIIERAKRQSPSSKWAETRKE